MKLSPKYEKAMANMQIGVISAQGFLGDEEINLVDIITRDENEFNKLGLKFDNVAKQLRHLLEKGQEGLGEPITVDNRWLVQVYEAKGNMPCPFEDYMAQKCVITLIDKNTNHKLMYTDLSIHLLEKHHFLEGKGSTFRLEPKILKEILY
ncbi:MAG: hypothetical protein JG768_234 [Fusobacteriales bacterium]|jgi:hypothetical protein|nr:hypothetical protein [Fusobacteriales bacterium]